MEKSYFHNNKSITENTGKKKSILSQKKNQKINVDINKLLNRIRVEKKNEIRKKIFFCSAVSIMLVTFGFTVILLK
tara:strand:+ start:460 stop:687 length:228 start_codon:yes stop_codon:yes gene_type:complete